MEGNLFPRRVRSILLILAALLVGFFWVLYDLQIVHGAEYLERSQRRIANTETVEAARGELLDRYGRVLVSNRISYKVTLNTSLMGESRNDVILHLLKICREEEVAWTDTLPITPAPPFTYTLDTAGSTAKTRFTALCKALKWTDGTLDSLVALLDSGAFPAQPLSADSMLAQMAADSRFKVEKGDLSDEDYRALIGVLYELTLRSKEVARVDYTFAQDVDIDFISKVKETGLVGVQISATTVREYHTAAAAHILGRVTQMDEAEWPSYQELGYAMDETVGRDGVEKAFETYLHGEEGTRNIETNTSGKVVSETYRTEPQPGENVVLTLDIRLQEAVEQSLSAHVPTLETAEGAAVAVVNVKNGDVLALASYPTFDLANFSAEYNDIVSNPLNPYFNRATQGTYAPGSVFKMVTAIGALEEGIITPKTQILDTGKYTYYKDYQPMCWYYRQYGRTHGLQNVSQAITNSCNVFFYDVGRRLGIAKLSDYARLFGLGEPTGIELPEKVGVIAGPEYTESIGQAWYEGNTLPAAIGQENNRFNPLQLANYVATLVNGGNHWSAHLLKAVKSSDFSEVVCEHQGELLDTVEIDAVNLDAVKEGMLAVTESGSVASYFKDLDVKVGAKTGSAQVGADSVSNAVFVCFAPYDDPEIALAIVVEKGGSGSELGAVAADILTYYFTAEKTLEAIVTENTLLR
ncbi:MAG: penicillin-binding protein [Clostridia bacterium]|nr:penicillin-binding protein [Clostridia bacterium]